MWSEGRSRFLSIVAGILMLAFGVIFLLARNAAIEFICVMLIILLLAEGVINCVVYFTTEHILPAIGWTLASGIVQIVFALYLIFNFGFAVGIFGTVVGILALVNAVSTISLAAHSRILGVRHWIALFGLGLLELIFSLMMLWNPYVGASFAVICLGIYMLIAGIHILVDMFFPN